MLLDAKRIFIENSFDFIVETIGIYSNYKLLEIAINIIIKKLYVVLDSFKENNDLIIQSNDTMENTYTLILKNEDYTVGKIIEYYLHNKYFKDEKKVNSYKKKHPATRVFQALRIFINDELNELDLTLKKSLLFLKKNGKIITVAFHSLEDKVIKNFFSRNKGLLKILTKKPVTPNEKEVKINPRSRSARMRVAEII